MSLSNETKLALRRAIVSGGPHAGKVLILPPAKHTLERAAWNALQIAKETGNSTLTSQGLLGTRMDERKVFCELIRFLDGKSTDPKALLEYSAGVTRC